MPLISLNFFPGQTATGLLLQPPRRRRSSVQFSPVPPQLKPTQPFSEAQCSSASAPPPKSFGRARKWALLSPPLGPESIWLEGACSASPLPAAARPPPRRWAAVDAGVAARSPRLHFAQLKTPLPVEYQLNTQLSTQLKTSRLCGDAFAMRE